MKQVNNFLIICVLIKHAITALITPAKASSFMISTGCSAMELKHTHQHPQSRTHVGSVDCFSQFLFIHNERCIIHYSVRGKKTNVILPCHLVKINSDIDQTYASKQYQNINMYSVAIYYLFPVQNHMPLQESMQLCLPLLAKGQTFNMISDQAEDVFVGLDSLTHCCSAGHIIMITLVGTELLCDV